MCVAVVKPAGVDISDEFLRNCWETNSHGAGFAYVQKSKVKIVKGLMTFDEFLAAYKSKAAKFKSTPFLIHFRIRSAGSSGADNTHPFEINNGALIHNGTIHGTGASYSAGESDTALFVKEFKDHLTFDKVEANLAKLEDALDYNKVAMLFGDSRYIIINHKKGVWEGGVWYSNSSFRSRFQRH